MYIIRRVRAHTPPCTAQQPQGCNLSLLFAVGHGRTQKSQKHLHVCDVTHYLSTGKRVADDARPCLLCSRSVHGACTEGISQQQIDVFSGRLQLRLDKSERKHETHHTRYIRRHERGCKCARPPLLPAPGQVCGLVGASSGLQANHMPISQDQTE